MEKSAGGSQGLWTADEIANVLVDYACGLVELPEEWSEGQRELAKMYGKEFTDYKIDEDGATLEQVMELEGIALEYARKIERAALQGGESARA